MKQLESDTAESPDKKQKIIGREASSSSSSGSADKDMMQILRQMSENQASFLTSMQSVMQQLATQQAQQVQMFTAQQHGLLALVLLQHPLPSRM